MEIKFDNKSTVDEYIEKQLNITNKGALEFLAASFYNKGLPSQKQAGSLIDKTVREFHKILLKYGFTLEGEETDQEIENDRNYYRNV